MNKDMKTEEYFLYRASPTWPRILMLTIVASFGFGFVFACFSRIDEVVVAKGELQALGAQKPIRSPISGIINNVLIKEGQRVKENSL